MFTPWPCQTKFVTLAQRAFARGVRRVLVTSPTGTGKCFGPGTPIMLIDGTAKPVEQIEVGDRLMGPDSRPRTVASLARGHGAMYRVHPTKGMSYDVNGPHILSLRLSPDESGQPAEHVCLSVEDYLRRNITFRHRAKGWRVAVDFPYREVPIDPYFLGIWLGDGTRVGSIEVTKPDHEVMAACHATAASHGLVVNTFANTNGCPTHRLIRSDGRSGRGYPNPLLELFRDLGLKSGKGGKFVPHSYKANAQHIRLNVLAGILDADGSVTCGGFDFISKDRPLADDVAWLARSLGLAAYVTTCEKGIRSTGFVGVYHRVSISGNCHLIPTRIARKKAPVRRQIKDVLRTGITVEPIGEGDYYGFEVEGPDRLFLLGDFTVAHNSHSVAEMVRWAVRQGWKAVVYTDRRLLVEQLDRVLAAEGVLAGVRAAGHRQDPDLAVQIASIPTEKARVLDSAKAGKTLHGEGFQCLAVFDEAHRLAHPTACEVIARHNRAGHLVLGVTATPLGLAHCYDELVVAGTVSEGRACGALVRARHYGPDEPDLRHVKRLPPAGEDLPEPLLKKLFRPTQKLFGRVFEWFDRLNPDRRPTILFAPGVAESVWFAQQFQARGVSAAHLDGSNVWIDGEFHNTSADKRAEVLQGSRDGRIVVLCNRFVLREGVDAPWLAHGVFATCFGSLSSYLQSGGRLLRAHPSLGGVTVQDHGGNWWRHGSLNADRHWRLEYTSQMLAGLRADGLRGGLCQQCGERLGAGSGACVTCGYDSTPEPRRCPACGLIVTGRRCPCGYEAPPGRRSRPVVMEDGELGEQAGVIFAPKRTAKKPDTQDLWKKMYYRARNSKNGMTFRQAEALFAHENHYWPPRDLKLMPRLAFHWWLKVSDVSHEDLL